MSLDELNKHQKDPTVLITDADGNVVTKDVPEKGKGERVVPANMPPERGDFQVRRRHMENHTLYEVWIPHVLYATMSPTTLGQLQSDNLLRVCMGLHGAANAAVEREDK